MFRIKGTSDDLQQAIWLWGRSCLIKPGRDTLLDSIIGLERLLVPSPGETRYRFGLHGAALLANSTQEAEEYARELKKLYDKRSGIAHGGNSEVLKEALKARDFLGKVILSTMQLIDSGVFQPSSSIPKQIEGKVLRSAPIANTQ